MDADRDEALRPVAFATRWIGIAVVSSVLVGVLVGLIRGDLSGTIGPVIQWGMTIAVLAIVGALVLRRR